MDYSTAKEKLAQYGQEHVLKYYEELNTQEQVALLEQVASTDFSVLQQAAHLESGEKEITPIRAMQLEEIREREDGFRATGLEVIRAGKVAAVLLAGGMGTRLGSDAPKGTYDIGLTKPVYIFERIVRNLLDVVEEAGQWIYLFVMTSEKNHEATVSFMKEHISLKKIQNLMR